MGMDRKLVIAGLYCFVRSRLAAINFRPSQGAKFSTQAKTPALAKRTMKGKKIAFVLPVKPGNSNTWKSVT